MDPQKNFRTASRSTLFPFGKMYRGNGVPGFAYFSSHNNIPIKPNPRTTSNDLNKGSSKTVYKTLISNSPRYNRQPPRWFYCQYNIDPRFKPTKSVIQSNEVADLRNTFESLSLKPTEGHNAEQKSHDLLNQKQHPESLSTPSEPGFKYKNSECTHPQNELSNLAEQKSSTFAKRTAPVPLWKRRGKQRWSEADAEFRATLDELKDVEINLEALQSIGIGPLCPQKKSMQTLVAKMNELCEYISVFINERHQVESRICGIEIQLKKHNYIKSRISAWDKIRHVRKWLCIEYEMSMAFVKNYGNYLPNEVKLNAIILLKELAKKVDKLSTFQPFRIVHKYGELTQSCRDRIEELEQLLSDIMEYLSYSISIFFVMRHCDFPNDKQDSKSDNRSLRNIFIG